ncbi:MAG: tetratricopeptide repeat protein [Candidatus Moraniibacteriota bacterium]
MKMKNKSMLILIGCTVIFVAFSILLESYLKVKKENAQLIKIARMATHLSKGEILQAVDYLDMLDYGGRHISAEFKPLANQVSKALALHLFAQARQEFERGEFHRSENDFGVAKFYAEGSGLQEAFPSWADNLGKRIKLYQEQKTLNREQAKISVARGWSYHFEGKFSDAIREYKKALEYDPDCRDAIDALRKLE